LAHSKPCPGARPPLTAALQRQSEAAQEARNGNDRAVEAAAQSWAEKGEAHRSLIYDLTNAALRKVAKAPPPLESWSDIERADKAGRRSCGLDDSERNQNINIGMQLVEFRLSQINLPPDVPNASSIVHGQDVTKPRL
jgi:hypothetical protein